jgi:hypothetical protein
MRVIFESIVIGNCPFLCFLGIFLDENTAKTGRKWLNYVRLRAYQVPAFRAIQ